MNLRQSISAALIASACAAAACGGTAPVPAPAAAPAGKRVDPATAGSVSGTVVFTGTPPAAELLPINSDPVCLQALGSNTKSDAVRVTNGRVENVFVYVEEPLSEFTFDVPAATVRLDQKGCRYLPRVFGVRVGQAIDIVNSDATLHDVHAVPTVNAEFNTGQPMQGSHMTKIFTAPEVMVRFKCDPHPWMAAFGGVMSHPFFAVTGADGTFSISGLPPGEFTLVAWHEKFGTQKTVITVGEKAAIQTTFTFAAKTAHADQ